MTADNALQAPGSKPFESYIEQILTALRTFDKVGNELTTWLKPWVGLDGLRPVFKEADNFFTTYVNLRQDLFDDVASIRSAVDLLVQAAGAAAAQIGRTEAEIKAAVDGALYTPPSGAQS